MSARRSRGARRGDAGRAAVAPSLAPQVRGVGATWTVNVRVPVVALLSIIVSGGTGTGRTTMLSSLSGSIPPAERIVTVEDSAELSLQQAHVVRLETLASMAETQVPFQALRDQINTAVDLVVQLERGADGTRRVCEVAAVSSRRREEFALTTLTSFVAEPLGRDRGGRGEHVHRTLPVLLVQRLHLAGEAVPPAFAAEPAAGGAPAGRGVVA